MKISITNDSGVLIEQIQQVEDYDLNKPLAAADLLADIISALKSSDAEPNATRGDFEAR